jgi:glycosyltransferase involved in cell wall biosynthesis
MLSGFQEIGYQVDTIWGHAADRQRALDAVKRNVKAGVRYGFLYSESSTMPTLLTENNHLPVHPFLDFGLFRFCQHAGIPVGLFYRDVHWRFEQYRRHVSWYKRVLTLPCYHLDLLAYRQWVDVLFLVHRRMLKYMRLWPQGKPVHELPPGGKTVRIGPGPSGGHLSLLYVGGVRPPLYDIGNLLDGVHRAVQGGVAVRLTICCPEEQWQARPESYDSWTGDWLTAVHLSGDDLQALYRQHHIAMVYLVPSPYFDFAIPVKLLEAIGFGRPVIAVEGTAISDFVRQEGCGWAVSADPAALVALLRNLQTTPERIEEKTQITQHIRPNHTWAKRAEQVADILTTVGEAKRHGGQA